MFFPSLSSAFGVTKGLGTPNARPFQVAGPCGARAGIPAAGGETMRCFLWTRAAG